MWGGSIKIGARPFWGRGVFVLVISNINIGFQKLLTLPLTSRRMYTHSLWYSCERTSKIDLEEAHCIPNKPFVVVLEKCFLLKKISPFELDLFYAQPATLHS